MVTHPQKVFKTTRESERERERERCQRKNNREWYESGMCYLEKVPYYQRISRGKMRTMSMEKVFK